MGHGVMKVSLQALMHAFHLPEDYRVIAAQQESGYGNILSILLESEDIPDSEDSGSFSEVEVRYRVEWLDPDNRDFRKITSEVEVKPPSPRLSSTDLLDFLR